MKWLLKAAVHQALSALPGGYRINYLLQRHITRSLPRAWTEIRDKFLIALAHWRAARDIRGKGPLSAYEFGAGWELVVAMGLYMLGVEVQVLVDRYRLARWELVEAAAGQMRRHHAELEEMAGQRLRPLPDCRGQHEALEALGIYYMAPCDAACTPLPAGSFHLVSSTQVLEHVPEAELEGIFSECARVVSENGVVSLWIDMADHYSYFDPAVGPYNFLRYPEGVWRLVNSSLHYQNRLRLGDYLRVASASGLRLVGMDLRLPTPKELGELKRMPLARPFRDRELAEVSVKGAHLVFVRG